MAKDIYSILEDDYMLLEEKGVKFVAKLIRSLLFARGYNSTKWDDAIREYLNADEFAYLEKDKRSSERSNLNRSLGATKVSWNVFKRFLSILAPVEIEYELRMHWNPELQFNVTPPKSVKWQAKGGVCDLRGLFNKAFNVVIDSTAIWTSLINRWIDRQEDGDIDNPPDRSTKRGNINKTFANNNSLSWGQFCKGLNILGILSGELVIRLKWKGGEVTTHTYEFDTCKESTNE